MIGQAVLIGAHSVILPGVTIGDAGSVGAMAVVTKSIEPGEMAAQRPWLSLGESAMSEKS